MNRETPDLAEVSGGQPERYLAMEAEEESRQRGVTLRAAAEAALDAWDRYLEAHDPEPLSALWADLEAASRVPGPTMTITKAQYGALLAALPVGDDTPSLDPLRALSDAATPGPWAPLTHGTASQRDAAGRAFQSVMAVHAPDNPDIEYTDLSWVETADPNGPHIALVGNGPTGPENSKFIAAAVNYVRARLAAATPRRTDS